MVGHSWGSVIGLKYIQLYPELIDTYIGCEQVVNLEKSSQLSYEYALQKNEERSNNKITKKIKSIDYAYTQETWLNDLIYVTKQVVKNEGSLYGRMNDNNLIRELLTSDQYSLSDLIHRQKGAAQFAPCASVVGHEHAVKEAARYTVKEKNGTKWENLSLMISLVRVRLFDPMLEVFRYHLFV